MVDRYTFTLILVTEFCNSFFSHCVAYIKSFLVPTISFDNQLFVDSTWMVLCSFHWLMIEPTVLTGIFKREDNVLYPSCIYTFLSSFKKIFIKVFSKCIQHTSMVQTVAHTNGEVEERSAHRWKSSKANKGGRIPSLWHQTKQVWSMYEDAHFQRDNPSAHLGL